MIEQISKYRSELMGIASIWVALYHFTSTLSANVLHYVSMTGYGGVDIFLFLSGFGLTYGYRHHSVGSFYWRRFIRLYPTYLVFLLIDYLLHRLSHQPCSLTDVLRCSTGIGYFFPHIGWPESDWYISFMYVLYLIFPLWMWLCKTSSESASNRRIYLCTSIAVTIGLIISGFIVMGQRGPMTILSATRIPIFFFGSMFGFLYIQRKPLAPRIFYTLSTLAAVAYAWLVLMIEHCNFSTLWRDGLLWFPLLLVTPGLVLAFVWLLQHTPKLICRPLAFLGTISLEFYLLHCFLLGYFKDYLPAFSQDHSYLAFLAFIAIAIVASWLFHLLMNLITKPFTQRRKQ